MTNSEKRYLQYFDSLFSFQGVLPNQRQVYLHKLILNTLPNLPNNQPFNPGLEIWGKGKMIFSSKVKRFLFSFFFFLFLFFLFSFSYSFLLKKFFFFFGNRSELNESGKTSDQYFFMDEYHVFFLCGTFQIKN